METPSRFLRSMLLMLGIILASLPPWELYWRLRHIPISYNEDNASWAIQRSVVDQPDNDHQTVIIGSSRIKFGFDLDTYTRMTGDIPIQLAREGTCPRPALHDLARDTLFTGILLIGITERLFFAPPGIRPVKEMEKRVDYFHHWTPAQKASASISRALESKFVFLEQENFSLNALLDGVPFPSRKGTKPISRFPFSFKYVEANRQTKMTDTFIHDPSLHERVKKIWKQRGAMDTTQGIGGSLLEEVLRSTKASIDVLKKRGVQVFFIRFPSSGHTWKTEQIAFPRHLYWDRLLDYTQTPGVHFEDYVELRLYRCLEESHLTPNDAALFTKALVRILKNEKGMQLNAVSPSTRLQTTP